MIRNRGWLTVVGQAIGGQELWGSLLKACGVPGVELCPARRAQGKTSGRAMLTRAKPSAGVHNLANLNLQVLRKVWCGNLFSSPIDACDLEQAVNSPCQ